MKRKVHVILTDDHAAILAGLESILTHYGLKIVGMYLTLEEKRP